MSLLTRKPKCYCVKGWWEYFENAQSRRWRRLSWVPVPNKHDGKGFRRLARHPENQGGAIFCAWCLLVELASKMPVRGILEDEDGPLTPEDMSDMTLYASGMFAAAIPILASPQIAWLQEVTDELRAEYVQSMSAIGARSEPKQLEGKEGKERKKGGARAGANLFPRELKTIRDAKQEQLQEIRIKYGLKDKAGREQYPEALAKAHKLEAEIIQIRDKLAASI